MGTLDAKPLPDILRLPEVAKYLRISRAQVYILAKRGEIPCFHVGTSPRVRRSDLEKWLGRQLQ
jgi:excisionase family DNA binding protein